MIDGLDTVDEGDGFGRANAQDRDVLERWAQSIRRVLVDGGIDRAAVGGEAGQVADILIERVFDLGVINVAQTMLDKFGIGEATCFTPVKHAFWQLL